MPRVLRWFAIAIAAAAVLDPALTSARHARPIVALAVADERLDSALATRVAQVLEDDFLVLREPFGAAAAIVVVGPTLPDPVTRFPGPAFALARSPAQYLAIDTLTAPPVAPAESRIPVRATIRAFGARGRTLTATLVAGSLALDEVELPIHSDDAQVVVPFTFVPASAGAARLRVVAALSESRQTAEAEVVVDVRARRYAVLFYDARPSWTSTFVRRAIERDSRFAVSSRVITARRIATEAGQPPTALDRPGALGVYDAVVIGAPDALNGRDAAALAAYARRRGGSIVLLLDQFEATREALTALLGDIDWADAELGVPTRVSGKDSTLGHLRAARLVWPVSLPPGAVQVAQDSAGLRPVLWTTALGAGHVVVSGAVDAWKARDPAQSGFDEFWQTLIGEAAGATPGAVELALPQYVLAPGERFNVRVTLTDAVLTGAQQLADPAAPLAGVLEGEHVADTIWYVPDGAPGMYRATVRAPPRAGMYRVHVSAAGAQWHRYVVVDAAGERPSPDHRHALARWVESRGGRTFTAAELRGLRSALASATHRAERPVTWRPMRSAWWIVPFAVALGWEWWWRRRRGLA